MAGEGQKYSAGNGVLIGRCARRHRFGRNNVAFQHSRLRSAAHTRSKGLRDHHSWIRASLYTAAQDPAICQHPSKNRFLLSCRLCEVSDTDMNRVKYLAR